MDWSRIKTIFIVSFLILDIFLFKEFLDKRNADQFNVLADATIEQQLEANGITYPTLPAVEGDNPSIVGDSKMFSNEDISELNNQEVDIIGDKKIVSSFKTPVVIDFKAKEINYDRFLGQVYEGNKYTYWKRDKESQIIYFVQKFNNKLIFNNDTSTIKAYYNNKGEITNYEQTYLDSIEAMESEDEDNTVISSTKALESLFVNNVIKPNSKVNKITLGYYKLVTLTSGVEVLVPTWHFTVNDTEEYYVNGLEGQIINPLESNVEATVTSENFGDRLEYE